MFTEAEIAALRLAESLHGLADRVDGLSIGLDQMAQRPTQAAERPRVGRIDPATYLLQMRALVAAREPQPAALEVAAEESARNGRRKVKAEA